MQATSMTFSEDAHGRRRGWATLVVRERSRLQARISGKSLHREFSRLGPTFQPTSTRTKMPQKKGSPDLHHRPHYRLSMATHDASVAHGLSVNSTTSIAAGPQVQSIHTTGIYCMSARFKEPLYASDLQCMLLRGAVSFCRL